MIIIDTREKEWTHIQRYFDSHCVPYKEEKLDTGDYFNTDHPAVIIDRKANLQEVCNNLSKGKNNRSRFVKECQRAHADKVKFIVLIEEGGYSSVKEVSDRWESLYSRHTGRWLAGEMFRLTCAYKVEWMFCDKRSTGRMILELTGYDS